jgi:hypothetical protein
MTTVQPLGAHSQVAPAAQLIVQPPPSQLPIEQVSPEAHAMLHCPPQLSMIRVEPSVPVPVGPMWQPASVHSLIRQVRPRSHSIEQPAPHSSISQTGPSQTMVHPPPHSGR